MPRWDRSSRCMPEIFAERIAATRYFYFTHADRGRILRAQYGGPRGDRLPESPENAAQVRLALPSSPSTNRERWPRGLAGGGRRGFLYSFRRDEALERRVERI